MIDLDRRELWRYEERVELTPNERLLLSIFLENRGRVLTHRELVREVKQEEVEEDRAPEFLRPIINRLRKNWMPLLNIELWWEHQGKGLCV